MSELISRAELLKELNNKEIEMKFELPVQEVLGEDIDMDDFCMLAQEIIQKYRELVIGVIQKRPTAYNVEKVVQQLKQEKIVNINSDETHAKTWNNAIQSAVDCIRNGGKADVPEINVGNNGWIPVSKRLPNEEEMKQAYCRNHYGSEFIVMIAGANRPTTLYRTMDGFWVDDEREMYKVLAWQPLPQPFKGE